MFRERARRSSGAFNDFFRARDCNSFETYDRMQQRLEVLTCNNCLSIRTSRRPQASSLMMQAPPAAPREAQDRRAEPGRRGVEPGRVAGGQDVPRAREAVAGGVGPETIHGWPRTTLTTTQIHSGGGCHNDKAFSIPVICVLLEGDSCPARCATKVIGFARTVGVSSIRASSIRAIAIMTNAVETNRILGSPLSWWVTPPLPSNCIESFSSQFVLRARDKTPR